MYDLEKIIDSIGLSDTLKLMATIAYEKADHVEMNWQDAGLAKLWDQAALKLEKLSTHVRI